jgi:endonuclease YncB( thermonuclease family)
MDGDTVELLVTDAERKQRVRIRLAGIDAPERSQAFGEVCRESLAGVVAGKDVQIRVRGKDRYSRTLGVIFVRKDAKGSTKDVNLGQISAGCAWHYKQYLMNQLPREREQYAAAEETARKARQGLWRDPHPQPPWEFRLSKKGRSSR